MERDCLIGHGVSRVIYERLMLSSDAHTVQVCAMCGLLAEADKCNFCGNSEGIHDVDMPYACKLLMQELMSMNVIMRLLTS